MAKNSHLPNAVQVSILLAVALLGSILIHYIDDAPKEIDIQLPNFFLTFSISIQMIVSLLVAAMLASGMYWLIQDHPQLDRGRSWHHIWLPALTTWATSTLINFIPVRGAIWWIVFALGGLILLAVLIAEYISIDASDANYQNASVVLTILAFCIFSAIVLTWHNTSYRLFILFPATFLAGGILAMRIFALRIPDSPVLLLSASLGIVAAHISTSLHYLPLTSIQYCLILVGSLYAWITLIIDVQKQLQKSRIVAGVLTIAAIFLFSAILIK